MRLPWWVVIPGAVQLITHPGDVQSSASLWLRVGPETAIPLHPWGFKLPTSNAGGRRKAG